MNLSIIGLCFLMGTVQSPGTPQKSVDQPAATTTTKAQQEVISLSKEKWQWMSERAWKLGSLSFTRLLTP